MQVGQIWRVKKAYCDTDSQTRRPLHPGSHPQGSDLLFYWGFFVYGDPELENSGQCGCPLSIWLEDKNFQPSGGWSANNGPRRKPLGLFYIRSKGGF